MILSDIVWEDWFDSLKESEDFISSFLKAVGEKYNEEDMEKIFLSIVDNQNPYSDWGEVIASPLSSSVVSDFENFKKLKAFKKLNPEEEMEDEFDKKGKEKEEEKNEEFDEKSKKPNKKDMKKLGKALGTIYKNAFLEHIASKQVKYAEISSHPVTSKKEVVFTKIPENRLMKHDLEKLGNAPTGKTLIDLQPGLEVSSVSTNAAQDVFLVSIKDLYERAYNDQLTYDAREKENTFFLQPLDRAMEKIKSNNVYAPAALIEMLLDPPGHRLKRENLYNHICDAARELLKDPTHVSEEELDLLNRVLIYRADVEDQPTGDRLIIPEELPKDDSKFIGCPHQSQAQQTKKIAEDLATAIKTAHQNLSNEELRAKLKKNLKNVATIHQEGGSFLDSIEPKDQRRFGDFMEALTGNADGLETRVFANGSIGVSSALEDRLNTFLTARGTGNRNPELARLNIILSDMKILIDRARPVIPKKEKGETEKEGTKPLARVAVVDQFPAGERDVRTITEGEKKVVNDPDHGLTVAKIAEVSGRGEVAIQKWASNALKACFEELKQDSDVQVVNFSSVLRKGDDADYQAFYELCLDKEVVVALGNNGRLLTSSNTMELRPGAAHGSSAHIELFIQGFADWLKKTKKDTSEVKILKLTICENFRMDKEELADTSSSIEKDHILYDKVLRVRGDSVINIVTGTVESGTSYVAPMMTGALASVPEERREDFKASCSNQILSWDKLVEFAVENSTRPSPSTTKDRHGFFKAADSSIVPEGIGAEDQIGPAKPSLSATDISKMRQIMPVFGESEAFTVSHRIGIVGV